MATHRQKLRRHDEIDKELPQEILPLSFRPWPEPGFRGRSAIFTGALLGAVSGCVSLVANIVGSTIAPAITEQPQHPLRLIQVFLTFPFGGRALELESGWVLGLGCLLFLVTGALYGVIFEYFVDYYLPRATIAARVGVFSVLAMALWIVNFYGILFWLQPLLFGGRWITELVPWWVAALTHLAFGLTMAIIQPVRSKALELQNSAR